MNIPSMDNHKLYQNLKILYCRANRLWLSHDFRSCLLLCDELSDKLNKLKFASDSVDHEVAQLRHLVWFLKIRCLADDYYINESLLLNEDDIEDDDQVQVFTERNTRQSRSAITRATSVSRKAASGTGKVEMRQRTGILTGRMPSISSRQSGRATSSYRPLTVSLTATQTAFSKSTRPLLRYSTCSILSKPIFEYLYNAQTVTNKCPDYRQCLEYLNLVKSIQLKESSRISQQMEKATKENKALLISTSDQTNELTRLGAFWLISFGICYFHLHMNKEAEEYFNEALSVNPKCLDSYTWLVKIFLRCGQPLKVLKICESGLKQSKNPILYDWIARVQSLLCDTYAANLTLQESLRYYPIHREALANVGYFAFYSDRLEQSLKCFERIEQLEVNQISTLGNDAAHNAQLYNNLALCNFYCGFFDKVMPLFNKSFLKAPNKETTSDIWYNMSFVPLSCGLVNLAIACLRLSLKNNSQNDEARNNLGVLRYGSLINDDFQFANRQEVWGSLSQKSNSDTSVDYENIEDQNKYNAMYDEAESHFIIDRDEENAVNYSSQPEMLYNMAILKKKRGHLLASVRYCNQYLEHDQNNYHMKDLLNQIRSLISHDDC